jgi:hypothetical protein
MPLYYQEILKIFPDLNWETLYYENSPRIRFYFDQMNIDLTSIAVLTTKIIAELFEIEDKIIV